MLVSETQRESGKAMESTSSTQKPLGTSSTSLSQYSHYLPDWKSYSSNWKESKTILLQKKIIKRLENYLHIKFCKLFTRVVTTHIRRPRNEQQPREQAGFYRNYCIVWTSCRSASRCTIYSNFFFLSVASNSVELNVVVKIFVEDG